MKFFAFFIISIFNGFICRGASINITCWTDSSFSNYGNPPVIKFHPKMAVVKGEIENFRKYYSENKNVRIIINDYISGEQVNYFSDIDSVGKFQFVFPIYHQQDIMLAYRQRWPGILVWPGDTVFIKFNADYFPEQIQFEGKTSEKSKQYQSIQLIEKERYTSAYFKRNKKLSDSLSFTDYKQWRDSLFSNDLLFMNQYCNTNNIAQDVYLTTKRDKELRYYSDLISYFKLEKKKAMDSAFFDFLKSFKLDSSYFTSDFLRHYTARLVTLCDGPATKLFSQKLRSLNEYNRAHPENHPILLSDDEFKKMYFDCWVVYMSQFEDKYTKDLMLTRKMYYNKKLFNCDLINERNLEMISDSTIRKRFLGEINKLNIQNNNMNAIKYVDRDEAERLLNNLRSKYKGKIIYIDFWATWCSPCYIEMKKSADIKEKYKNGEVAFVYICCESDKNIWKKRINELNISGEHIFLDTKQYKYIYQKFRFSGFPHYILLDKQGKIVNTNAPGPSDSFDLINEINKLIKK